LTLCANLLQRQFRRLMLPLLNLQPSTVLGAVVERLLKAMRSVRPQNMRPSLATQHDLARRLDE
jgi:hypothetical protein